MKLIAQGDASILNVFVEKKLIGGTLLKNKSLI